LEFNPWLGDLHSIGLPREIVGVICIVTSGFCGAIVGMERERRDKPAGLRTVILISVGSTIFTMVSLLLSSLKPTADPARLAAQILPGIGFLGAGAIIHARGTVLGLTTGATIWTVAAVGVTIGAGYVAAGIFFTLLIFFTLDILHRVDWLFTGRCRLQKTTIVYKPDSGKTFPRLLEILDRFRIPDANMGRGSRENDLRTLTVTLCTRHRHHRVVFKEVAEVPEVTAIEVEENGWGDVTRPASEQSISPPPRPTS
jgi:putative Mg2+ transporter-C (MgtC) family protein